MANRYPLIVDSSSAIIKELPSADGLELGNSNIANVGNINVTYTANLGAVGNITITGGTNGQLLKTNGSGVLAWTSDTAPPAGSNTQVQFNDSSTIGASSNFTFNKSTQVLTVTGNISVGNITSSAVANLGSIETPLTMAAVGNVSGGNLVASLGTVRINTSVPGGTPGNGTVSLDMANTRMAVYHDSSWRYTPLTNNFSFTTGTNTFAVTGNLSVDTDIRAGNTVIINNTGYLVMNTVSTNTKFVALQAPASIGSLAYLAWQLPNTSGNVGEFLTTDGAGVMDWSPQLASSTVPLNASAAGTAGEIAFDASYIYICVASSTWKRAALTTWS
jgi:hypothetical protein